MATLFFGILGTISYLFVVPTLPRIFDKPPVKEPVIPSAIGMFDPVLGWKLKPNSRAASRRTGVAIEYQIDAEGRRAIDNDGANTDCRIVALGDSNTFGFGTAMKNHWLTKMREILPLLEIYNLGVAGYGVDQELLRFRLEGAALRPRLVIAYVKHFGEDRHLHAYRFGKAKPYFLENTNGDLVVHTEHIKKDANPNDFLDLGYSDFPKQKMQLGVRIIKEMWIESERVGSHFLLLAGWEQLCEEVRPISCVVFKQPQNSHIITPDGEDLLHLNTEANSILGTRLVEYLRLHSMLPAHCL